MTTYFQHHVFFCNNIRATEPGAVARACCGGESATAAQQHAKRRVKALGLNGEGKVRINQAGCLDRCEQGPCLVVYPEGTWYTYLDNADIDEIVDQHLVQGKIVNRLLIQSAA